MSIRPLENLWNFALDNPEISIFIVTALFGGLTWLFQKFKEPIRNWVRNGKGKNGQTSFRDSGDESLPSPSAPRNWFVNVGEHVGHLKWEDCVQYGCISAGGGPQFARALRKLDSGDTVYAYVSGAGYIGAGKVVKTAVPIHKFTTQDNTPLLKNELATENINNSPDNLDSTDWVAGIDWVKAFDREHASRDTDHYIATLCEIRDSGRLASLRKTFGT